jgi:hypothetical protein
MASNSGRAKMAWCCHSDIIPNHETNLGFARPQTRPRLRFHSVLGRWLWQSGAAGDGRPGGRDRTYGRTRSALGARQRNRHRSSGPGTDLPHLRARPPRKDLRGDRYWAGYSPQGGRGNGRGCGSRVRGGTRQPLLDRTAEGRNTRKRDINRHSKVQRPTNSQRPSP